MLTRIKKKSCNTDTIKFLIDWFCRVHLGMLRSLSRIMNHKKSFMRSRCITDLFSSLILSHSLTYSFSLTTKKFFSQHYTAVVIVVSGQVYYLVEISSETFNEWMRGKIRELHAQYSPLLKHRRILKSAAAGSAYVFLQQQLATIVRVRAKDFFSLQKPSISN